MTNDQYPMTKREGPTAWQFGRHNALVDSFVRA